MWNKVISERKNPIQAVPEAGTRGVLRKKMFLEISQNSQENTCARVSFLIKLQAWGFSCQFCEIYTFLNTSGRVLLYFPYQKNRAFFYTPSTLNTLIFFLKKNKRKVKEQKKLYYL